MNSLWLIPLLPLLGSAVCGWLHFATLRARRENESAEGSGLMAGFVATGAVIGSLLIAVSALFASGLHEGSHSVESSVWSWIDMGGGFSIELAMVFDRLSAVMTLVICGVGALIHIYSIGYIKSDPGFSKFFAYLNLFIFAMLMLVLSSNLLGLFVGWEGVGLCSYLLIGFWYEKGWPAEAGQKAFVVNRIGDACFLIGSFLLVDLFATLDFSEMLGGLSAITETPGAMTKLTFATLLLFGGACGKSAQFPLFTWLPDAMAGPTPVSALIHAATMVTAGIYLIVRLNPLFASVPMVLMVIGSVGALTALIGASTALLQRDIKKVLAYSTVSQLGYMFLALGAGAWAAAMFHLVTHAFFKGLLFLGSGSVIHGMHEEQDMHKMGGLRKHMPRTYATFVAGALALSGMPLMSGYFSKDEILAHNFASGGLNMALWMVGILAAALTAFYTWRMVALTFHGEERFDAKTVHPHESPASMTVPLIVLAVLSVFGGLLGLPAVFGDVHFLENWLHPITAQSEAILGHGAPAHSLSHTVEWILLGLGAAIAMFFAHRGFHAYTGGIQRDLDYKRAVPDRAEFLENAWRIDSIYHNKIIVPLKLFSFLLATLFDQFIIDGAVNGSAVLARKVGGRLRSSLDGNVKTYALWIGGGAAILVALWRIV